MRKARLLNSAMPHFVGLRMPVLAGAALLAGLAPAQADAIDGAWCSDNGRRIAIEGSSVTTPKGVRMQGAYTRHTFAFTMPGEEVDAGASVDMVLQGEYRVRVRIGAGEVQVWQRCPPGIS